MRHPCLACSTARTPDTLPLPRVSSALCCAARASAIAMCFPHPTQEARGSVILLCVLLHASQAAEEDPMTTVADKLTVADMTTVADKHGRELFRSMGSCCNCPGYDHTCNCYTHLCGGCSSLCGGRCCAPSPPPHAHTPHSHSPPPPSPPPPPPLPPPPPPLVPPPFSPVNEQFVRVVGRESAIQFGQANGGTGSGTVCELRMDHRHSKLVSTCELDTLNSAPACTHRAGLTTPSTHATGNMAFGTGSRAHCLAGETVTGGYCIPSGAACGTAATSGTGSNGRMFYECINAGCGSSTDRITGYAICCAF